MRGIDRDARLTPVFLSRDLERTRVLRNYRGTIPDTVTLTIFSRTAPSSGAAAHALIANANHPSLGDADRADRIRESGQFGASPCIRSRARTCARFSGEQPRSKLTVLMRPYHTCVMKPLGRLTSAHAAFLRRIRNSPLLAAAVAAYAYLAYRSSRRRERMGRETGRGSEESATTAPIMHLQAPLFHDDLSHTRSSLPALALPFILIFRLIFLFFFCY